MTASRAERHDARERALDALALARREKVSLSEAARRVRSDPRTVLRHAGHGFRKEGRRYRARPFDRIPRQVAVLQPKGAQFVTVRDSRQASAIAEQANAVQHYIERGDRSRLDALRGRRIRVERRDFDLYLEPRQVEWLAEGGELHYELYRR